jgi:branched-subunit amino acid permease
LPEREKPTLAERLAQAVIGRTLEGVGKSAKKFVKRTLRLAGLVLTGVVVSILGVVFLAVGAVKWLGMLMPIWLAWMIIGIILLLIGALVAIFSWKS